MKVATTIEDSPNVNPVVTRCWFVDDNPAQHYKTARLTIQIVAYAPQLRRTCEQLKHFIYAIENSRRARHAALSSKIEVECIQIPVCRQG